MLERVWRKGTLLNCLWEGTLVQPLWKTVWRYVRKLCVELPYDPAIPLLGIYLDKTFLEKDTCTCMFTAALLRAAKTWKKLNVWIKKVCYIYTLEYFSFIKNNEIMPFAATWMGLETFILNEVSQKEKDKYHMISLE